MKTFYYYLLPVGPKEEPRVLTASPGAFSKVSGALLPTKITVYKGDKVEVKLEFSDGEVYTSLAQGVTGNTILGQARGYLRLEYRKLRVQIERLHKLRSMDD
jgi:hypothetical protein